MKDTYAFPAQHYDLAEGEHGMTLRDYFAAKAMPMALAEYRMLTEVGENDPMGEDWGIIFGLSSVAAKAYQLADAMLEARGE